VTTKVRLSYQSSSSICFFLLSLWIDSGGGGQFYFYFLSLLLFIFSSLPVSRSCIFPLLSNSIHFCFCFPWFLFLYVSLFFRVGFLGKHKHTKYLSLSSKSTSSWGGCETRAARRSRTTPTSPGRRLVFFFSLVVFPRLSLLSVFPFSCICCGSKFS